MLSGKKKGATNNMNKIKMGKFLKQLRNDKGMTMNDLISELNKEYLGVTIKTVADWESGKTIPEIEKLQLFSNLFSVSLDEILNGERVYTKENFLKQYPLFTREFDKMIDTDYKLWFNLRTKYIKQINKRFKALICKYYEYGLTKNEDIELGFLFKGKCSLSSYFDKQIERKFSDEYFDFISALKTVKSDKSITNKSEFYWEVQKYYDVKCLPCSSVSFSAITDEEFVNNEFVQMLIEQSESWELDMLLAGLQNFDPASDFVNTHSYHLKRYKERHGKEFNKEVIFKNTLKYLLSKGAMVNPYFFNFKEKRTKTINIIDRLEELYQLCERPIEVFVSDNTGKQKRYLAESTPFNRFLSEYYSFRYALNFYSHDDGITPQEVFDLIKNDKDDSRAISIICKQNKVDTKREKAYVLADIHYELSCWKELKEKYLSREQQIKNGLDEIKELKNLLKTGVKTFEEYNIVEVGPKNSSELLDYIKLWKSNLSLQEFNGERNKQMTNSLIQEVDNLSVNEIREKYFSKEIMDGETHD